MTGFGSYIPQTWTPKIVDGLPRRYLRSGVYQAYLPALMKHSPPPHPSDIDLYADVSAAVARVVTQTQGSGWENLLMLMLRSEAQGSSRIEGYPAGAATIALADVTGHGSNEALTTLRNVTIM